MQTRFSPGQLCDPAYQSSDEELRACLQCDYCIVNCPTYKLLGDELDSSRGRIFLIRNMLESGGEPEKDTVQHIDQCLSCLACMSTCPSSVNYMHLVDHAREYIEENYTRPIHDRLLRWGLARVLPYPRRFRVAMRGAQLARPLAFTLPNRVRRLVDFTPDTLPPASPNDKPQIFTAHGDKKYRVALLTGCAQKVLNTDVNDATIRVLRRHGCEVVVADGADCCGALTHHMGKTQHSFSAASASIRAWISELDGDGLDAVVINTSGCGTVVKDYGHMFRSSKLAAEAQRIADLTKDISEFLSEIQLDYRPVPALRVAYHATCSLQFGQRVRFTPKKLLKRAGFTILEPRDAHACCGAAGTFNLLQPRISDELKARKIAWLEESAPDAIAAGNIGCMMQIGSGTQIPVAHTVELLDWATGGPVPPTLAGIPETSS